jgi:hypothetical protein
MAAGAVRARADYDYLIKLLLIGDSGKKNMATLMCCCNVHASTGLFPLKR